MGEQGMPAGTPTGQAAGDKRNGLELSRELFQRVAPELERQVPDLWPQLAIGRVGEGSECWGYDDEVSRDHDWGAGLVVWVPDELFGDPKELAHAASRISSVVDQACAATDLPVLPFRPPRFGVWRVGDFYKRFIGLDRAPRTDREWLAMHDQYLAVCTNGEVFQDNAGAFTRVREELRRGFPVDVLLRKLAWCSFSVGQSGQYNLLRMLQRGDVVAAQMLRATFLHDAMRASLLVRGRFTPFDKWLGRAFAETVGEQTELVGTVRELAVADLGTQGVEAVRDQVERVCLLLLDDLRQTGLPVAQSHFMVDEAFMIHDCIESQEVSALPFMVQN